MDKCEKCKNDMYINLGWIVLLILLTLNGPHNLDLLDVTINYVQSLSTK